MKDSSNMAMFSYQPCRSSSVSTAYSDTLSLCHTSSLLQIQTLLEHPKEIFLGNLKFTKP